MTSRVTMTTQASRGLGRIVGVIPARLESRRLPRKVLRPICGRPMILWTYERARQAAALDHLLVAADSEEVLHFCQKAGVPALLTSTQHASGTDRLVEVMAREPAEIFVNVQGDEPMVTAEHLDLLLQPFRSDSEAQVSTLKVEIPLEEARDPNNVKVVTDLKGRALYFSRALIPFDRDGGGQARYYKHLGFYAFRASALEHFRKFCPSTLEQNEKLEQLRFLENGIPITVVETFQDTIGVDTEEDLRRVEEQFRRNGICSSAG